MQRTGTSRRIGIIGAGGLGSCAALELASRGYEVELFERRDVAVSEASLVNEGKIHLGFIYAMDRHLRTAATMIEGALQFEEGLQRWMPFRAKDVVSTPFYYCVHRGSLLDADAVGAHYDRCAALYTERARATDRDYLGLGTGCAAWRVSERELSELVDPRYFSAAFRTTEHAVDPRVVAQGLREALASEPRILLRPRHRVTAIDEVRGGFRLAGEHDGAAFREAFTDVVNASWYERLPLDRRLGILPPGPWSHRYKFGNRVHVRLAADQIPSCTSVQGPFGDIVNFGERGMFVSWYPIGRTGMTSDEVPPNWHDAYSDDERHDVFARSFAAWCERCPRLRTLDFTREQVTPYGGVIYALGTTDVDDGESELHNRYEIGIQSRGRYHSVDTGKYTLVPYWARRTADRVEGIA